MPKYYRVLKDNFLWEVGAILEEGRSGYQPVDEVFCKTEHTSEYITNGIIENQPEWFERVYKIDGLTKATYVLKDKARELLKRDYQE